MDAVSVRAWLLGWSTVVVPAGGLDVEHYQQHVVLGVVAGVAGQRWDGVGQGDAVGLTVPGEVSGLVWEVEVHHGMDQSVVCWSGLRRIDVVPPPGVGGQGGSQGGGDDHRRCRSGVRWGWGLGAGAGGAEAYQDPLVLVLALPSHQGVAPEPSPTYGLEV